VKIEYLSVGWECDIPFSKRYTLYWIGLSLTLWYCNTDRFGFKTPAKLICVLSGERDRIRFPPTWPICVSAPFLGKKLLCNHWVALYDTHQCIATFGRLVLVVGRYPNFTPFSLNFEDPLTAGCWGRWKKLVTSWSKQPPTPGHSVVSPGVGIHMCMYMPGGGMRSWTNCLFLYIVFFRNRKAKDVNAHHR